MMVRYVTPTGRLGRILADAAIRIVRINENNDRTLIRVGALLISLSRYEIVLSSWRWRSVQAESAQRA
jgi:hypothetical protein